MFVCGWVLTLSKLWLHEPVGKREKERRVGFRGGFILEKEEDVCGWKWFISKQGEEVLGWVGLM